MSQYILGIDVGTEGTKVIVMDRQGAVVHAVYASYQYDMPLPGWTEQDPTIWWDTVVSCLQQVWKTDIAPADIAGLGVTGQMHSPILLDESGRVIRKSILWNDTRAAGICFEFAASAAQADHKRITCNNLLPGFTASSLLWMRDHEPEKFQRIDRLMLPKDYINLRLTDKWSTDPSDASGTGLFDMQQGEWSDPFIDAFGFRRAWFPEVVPSGSIIGAVTPQAARLTGLREGLPVIAGAADNSASMIGTGILHQEAAAGMLTVGTSGAVVVPLQRLGTAFQTDHDTPERIPLHIYCHAVPDLWVAAGCSLAAGAALRWFKDRFAPLQSYESLLNMARAVEPGSEGVLFLPFLTGDRSVYRRSPIQAGFTGLSLHHTAGHLARSVIEGVSYSLRDAFERVRQTTGAQLNHLIATGGFVQSPVWPQILCDVLDIPLKAPLNYQGAAYGIGLLVGHTLGLWSLDGDWFHGHELKAFFPADNRQVYQLGYKRYRAAMDALGY